MLVRRVISNCSGQFFRRNMCILFMYDGSQDADSDYSFVLAANRDELYQRPSKNMEPWSDDPQVIGGRDLEAGGTWLAVSPIRRKVGILLNLPRDPKPDAKTRGSLVADYVRSETPIKDYLDGLKSYVKECNNFVFIAVELRNLAPSVYTYSNESDLLSTHADTFLGFGNSLPNKPLKKVEAGRCKLKDICSRLNKIQQKKQLVDELINMLKSEERHLPDPELVAGARRPVPVKASHLSTIFVRIPEIGYGTRTHTLMLVTKTGHVDVIELTLQPPIDIDNPNWHRSEFQFDINSHL